MIHNINKTLIYLFLFQYVDYLRLIFMFFLILIFVISVEARLFRHLILYILII